MDWPVRGVQRLLITVHISCWHPIPTKTSVLHFWRSVCSCRQTTHCGTSCLLCRWRACLERSSCRRHFSTFPTHFPKTFKTAPLPTLLSWLCPLNSLLTPFVLLVVAVCYLGHVKNFLTDWLIDWRRPNQTGKKLARVMWHGPAKMAYMRGWILDVLFVYIVWLK